MPAVRRVAGLFAGSTRVWLTASPPARVYRLPRNHPRLPLWRDAEQFAAEADHVATRRDQAAIVASARASCLCVDMYWFGMVHGCSRPHSLESTA